MIKVEELTFAYIQKFCDFEKDIVLTNHFHTDWEADILVINQDGFSHEIEIKLSKSDFKNDFKSILNCRFFLARCLRVRANQNTLAR